MNADIDHNDMPKLKNQELAQRFSQKVSLYEEDDKLKYLNQGYGIHKMKEKPNNFVTLTVQKVSVSQ